MKELKVCIQHTQQRDKNCTVRKTDIKPGPVVFDEDTAWFIKLPIGDEDE